MYKKYVHLIPREPRYANAILSRRHFGELFQKGGVDPADFKTRRLSVYPTT